MIHTTNFRRASCLLLVCFILGFWLSLPITAHAASVLDEYVEWVEQNEPGYIDRPYKYQQVRIYQVTFSGYPTANIAVFYNDEPPVLSSNSKNNLTYYSDKQYLVVYLQEGKTSYGDVASYLLDGRLNVGYEVESWYMPVTKISLMQIIPNNPLWDGTYENEPTPPDDDDTGGTGDGTGGTGDGTGGTGDGTGGTGDGSGGTDLTETHNWLEKIYQKLCDLAEAITSPITTGLNSVKTTLGNIGNLIQQQVVGGITAVKNAVNSVGNGVTQVVDFFTGTSYVESPTVALKFGSLFDLFPFNIPKGIYDAISFWEASASPPVITIPLPSYTGGAMDIYEFEINFSEIPGMDAIAALIRSGELILFVVGLVILTEKVTKW